MIDHLWCEFVLLSLTKVCPPCRLVLKFVHPAGLLPWDNTPGENSSLLVWMAVEQPYLQSADGDQKEPIPTIPLFHCPVCFWMILLWTVFGKNVAISPLSLGVRTFLAGKHFSEGTHIQRAVEQFQLPLIWFEFTYIASGEITYQI